MQNNFFILVRRINLLVLIYFFCRFAFFLFNESHFEEIATGEILLSLFIGMRYDITVIVISNIIFIAFHFFAFRFFYTRSFQLFLKTLFLVVNIPLILLNCIDLGLFRFTGKRSGAEIFSIMSFGNDFVNTVPKMIADFWYLLILFFALVYVIIRIYPQLPDHHPTHHPEKGNLKSVIKKTFLFLLFFTITFIGFRGGIQYKPLNILSASKYNDGKTASLILNTPFTVIKTIYKESLPDLNFMSEAEAMKISPYTITPSKEKKINNKNVVLIILEGIGKEYIGSMNNYPGYTPFLDSLIKGSLAFTNGYSNGKRSIEGIPSIVAGIPAIMPDPFITSRYSGNSISTIPSLLKPKGYSTEFFHGGTNGTMGFDNFSKLSGYEIYFGRNEYNNDDDFDGSWGIYDGPFLQRTVDEMSKMKPPFFSTIFTLSSHHPYKIPDSSAVRLANGTLPIHQSIRYADQSLKEFFRKASGTEWFSNTLFVITSDHTALSDHPFYLSRTGMYSVPLIFYSHGDSLLTGMNDKPVQQIDILPSVMDYLNYDTTFFSFGKSVFDNSQDRFVINYLDGTYQLINKNYSLISDLNEKSSLYDYKADSTLMKDLYSQNIGEKEIMEKQLRAFVQNYNEVMIHNRMK